MALSRKQALAFFKAVLVSKDVQRVSEGFLGIDAVPTIEEINGRNPAVLDKCEEFAAYALATIKMVAGDLAKRERQKEIDFDKPKKKVSGLANPKKKAAHKVKKKGAK